MRNGRTTAAAILLSLAVWAQPPIGALASSAEVRRGLTSVRLEPYGNSYIAKVELNDSVRAQFLVDTGASATVLTPEIARRIGITGDDGRPVTVTVADGRTGQGRLVTVDEIRIGRASVYDSEAIVLEYFSDTGFDGLLGMTFLGHFSFKIDHDDSKLVLYERD